VLAYEGILEALRSLHVAVSAVTYITRCTMNMGKPKILVDMTLLILDLGAEFVSQMD